MPQHSLFDITPDQIAALDDEGLRLLIARLCESELRRRGLPATAVLYGGNQIAADGGIDVRVELPAETDIAGAIPRPNTGFQAKADDMPASEIEKEMCPKIKQTDGTTVRNLRPSIRDLGAMGGAYVIVSSKDSTTDSMLKDRRDAMARAVADLEYPKALHVDFYDRQRMATWVSEHLGEMLWLRDRIGQPLHGWRPHGNWSGAPEGDDNEYLRDDTCRLTDMRDPEGGPHRIVDGIARLRSLLSEPRRIVRLTGLSGTGKTRLLEALFDQSIGDQSLDPALAVYVDVGHEAPEPSPGQLAHQLTAEGKRTILLMDNCPRETHDPIANVCKAPESPLSLITVDLDIADEKPEDTDVFRLRNASEAVIEALVERRYPMLPKAICQRIAEFSNGNTRIANLTAQRVGPDTNLADLGDEVLFKKLFHQHKQVDDTLLRAAEALALVYSFDGETFDGASAELPFIAERADLSTREVYRAVAELQRREIIQTRGRWRAILPQPLANWLAKRTLQNLPAIRVANAFWQSGNTRLLKSFAHRLSYLHDSDQARAIAMDWLAANGRLANLRGLDQSRFDVINYLAPVAPDATLDLIERHVLASDLKELTFVEFRHRGPVMLLLRKLAFFPEHFRRAVFLLCRFLQAESDWTSRLDGAQNLQDLFRAKLSGTQASPRRRLEVVEELLADPDDRARAVGIIALRSMLRACHFSSSHDFTFGGHSVDFGWLPRTRTDYINWYCGALAILTRLATADSPHRTTARKLIAESFRDLWSFAHVFDCLEETSIAIGTDEYWPDGWLAVRQTLCWDGDRMAPALVARLRLLEEQLAPEGVAEEIRAYVLVPATNIADARRWESGDEYQRSLNAVFEKARELGRQVGKDPDSIGSMWQDLLGPDAAQGTWFGEGVAETVADLPAAWRHLIQRFRLVNAASRNPSVLGGFLRRAAIRDKEVVEQWLTDAVTDDLIGSIFPLLQFAVGVDRPGAQRLIVSIQKGMAPPLMYRSWRGEEPVNQSHQLILAESS